MGARVVAALAALVLTCALFVVAGSASAADGKGESKGKVDRVLSISVGARATNDYRFQFSAFRGQPGGATALIQVRNRSSSATYVLERPDLVTKRRLKADFGELGVVSLRFDELDSGAGRDRCGRTSFKIGRFRGKIRFDGESSFTTVRSQGDIGLVISRSQRRGCGRAGLPFPFPFPFRADRPGTVVTSCGPGSRLGFLAFEPFEDGPAEFLLSKFERAGEVDILRMNSLEGPSRTYAADLRASTARLTPPEPYAGRGFLSRGELRGNLRAPLPGAGMVELTPGDAELSPIEDFSAPECFPQLLTPGDGFWSVSVAVANEVIRKALTSGAKRLFAG